VSFKIKPRVTPDTSRLPYLKLGDRRQWPSSGKWVRCPTNIKPPASLPNSLQDAFTGATRTIMAPVKRRDLILAAIAVFVAWGYLTHWQPKLHYLPYSFVAGVLATLALLAWLTFTIAWDKDVRSGGEVDYGPRHVAFVAPERWKAEREALDKRNMYMMEPLYPASFMISDSIDVLIGLILRDFVKSWYGSISKSPTFVNEVDRAVRATMGEIRERILAVDMVETVVSRMIPLTTCGLRTRQSALFEGASCRATSQTRKSLIWPLQRSTRRADCILQLHWRTRTRSLYSSNTYGASSTGYCRRSCLPICPPVLLSMCSSKRLWLAQFCRL
jgi:hypothetical protein